VERVDGVAEALKIVVTQRLQTFQRPIQIRTRCRNCGGYISMYLGHGHEYALIIEIWIHEPISTVIQGVSKRAILLPRKHNKKRRSVCATGAA